MAGHKSLTPSDTLFISSLALKGLSGFAELLSGLLLIFISPQSLLQFVAFLTQRELVHYHHDRIAAFVLQATQQLGTGSRAFIVLYLLVHAGINLLVVGGLLKNQRWAYPFSAITLGLFLAYQLYVLLFAKASVGIIALILFDMLVLWLIWQEYRKLQS